MPTYKFSKAYSQRGAQMGRASFNKPPQKPRSIRLFRVDLVDETAETLDAEEVIANAGPADKTVPAVISDSDDDEDEEIVLDEADEIDLDEDGLSVEVADEFNDEETQEEA